MLSKVNYLQREFRRGIIDWSYKKKLCNKDFTIFSSNCVGGVIYHSLDHKFLSPTINLFFEAKDYLMFLKNPRYYTIQNPVFNEVKNSDVKWPVVQINDITVNFMHYRSYDEAVKKWTERSTRINWDNIYVILSEADGCTFEDISIFDNLSFPNKVIFTHKEMPQINSAYYLRRAPWIDNEETVRLKYPLTGYVTKTSPLRYIDEYDYVDFLNRKTI